ncbi:MAG: hypothetical protein Q4F71_01820 [Paracoccus sp. (in: a-proteobacteria)]|nr:hypothetical protein [Paracoccus sp. (in: a-proteobacteria)]
MTTLKLPKRLDLTAAKPLARDLGAIEGGVTLDAGEVEHLGGLCLQILLASARSRAQAGYGTALAACSDAFDGAIAQFGLTRGDLESEAAA